jgi:Flp pilus assembly pilin Flp
LFGGSRRVSGDGGFKADVLICVSERRVPLRLLLNRAAKRLDDHQGVTALEYALLAALIVIAAIFAISSLGDVLFDSLNDTMQQVQSSS